MRCPRCETFMIQTIRRENEASAEYGMSTLFAMRECPRCGITITTSIPLIATEDAQKYIEGGL